jgi:hypothetical protein
VPYFFQLLHSVPDLHVRVVPRSYGSHAGRLVARVGLSGVLEIRVGSAGAVNAYVPGGGYVGASVRLAHDSDHCYAGGSPHWFCF